MIGLGPSAAWVLHVQRAADQNNDGTVTVKYLYKDLYRGCMSSDRALDEQHWVAKNSQTDEEIDYEARLAHLALAFASLEPLVREELASLARE